MLTVCLALLFSITPSSSHLTPPGTLHEINVHHGERSLFWKDLRQLQTYKTWIPWIHYPHPHLFTHGFEYAAAPLTGVLASVWVKCQRFIRNRSADGPLPHFGDAVKRREAHLCHGWHFNLLPLAVLFPSIVHQCIRTNVMGHRRISAFNSIDRHLWLRLYCCRCREKETLTWKNFAFTHLTSMNFSVYFAAISSTYASTCTGDMWFDWPNIPNIYFR